MTVGINGLNWFWFIVINAVLIASIVKCNNKEIEDVGALDELVSANVVYRHGNRSIVLTYPNDPYKDKKWWPDGYGQLTNSGKHLQYRLGQFFRRRYLNLIGHKYSKDTVYIQSDKDDRNLMSAACNNFGLFPAYGDQIWGEKFNWQPIPIHELPPDLEHLLTQDMSCKYLNASYTAYLESNEIQSQLKKIKKLRKYLEYHSGITLGKLPNFISIYDAIETETLYGLPMPEWARPIWANEKHILEHFTALNYIGYSHSTELKKISAGFLIRKFLDRFKSLRTTSLREPKQKLWLYSGHDVIIITLMNALNVYKMDHLPPFSSSFHFELYRSALDEYYVQIFYRSDDSEYVPPIEIPGCGTKCPLDQFLKLYAHILPNENETFESLCNLKII